VTELTRPDVAVPEGLAPTELVIEDQVVGEGAEAIVGSQIRAHYIGVAHSTGKQFDASWDRGSPLEFRLGTGRVIKGWDDGIVGMRVGGRRRLTIPRTWLTVTVARAPRSSLARPSSSSSTWSASARGQREVS
jgi:peptidylprolyl isomerase